MKIITILGARPQFIKASVVSRAMENYNEENRDSSFNELIIHTGQHYDLNMTYVFFQELKLPPIKFSLEIKCNTHGAMTGRMLEKIEEILLKEKPDIVLVYGDTNSTLAGALAAAKLAIPIAHVEAGLRSFNMRMPEEINRILTDRVSQWLFCPTENALINLKKEGFTIQAPGEDMLQKYPAVCNVGDVMYDISLFCRQIIKSSDCIKDLIQNIGNNFYLATIHREENTNSVVKLKNIISALDEISIETPVILPIHPRTRKLIFDNKIDNKNISIIDPLGYYDMMELLKNCKAVFTDSGGLQKEAYFFKKLCITLREETEWVELVENGFNFLTGAGKKTILTAEKDFLNHKVNWNKSLYGNGNAGEKIVDILAAG